MNYYLLINYNYKYDVVITAVDGTAIGEKRWRERKFRTPGCPMSLFQPQIYQTNNQRMFFHESFKLRYIVAENSNTKSVWLKSVDIHLNFTSMVFEIMCFFTTGDQIQAIQPKMCRTIYRMQIDLSFHDWCTEKDARNIQKSMEEWKSIKKETCSLVLETKKTTGAPKKEASRDAGTK